MANVTDKGGGVYRFQLRSGVLGTFIVWLAVTGCYCDFGRTQDFLWGFKAGVPLTPAVETNRGDSEAHPYRVGPTLEIGLLPALALEVSALYRRTGYSADRSSPLVSTFTRTRANSWEFPMLAKWYISPNGRLRTFISGGYVFRNLWNVEETVRSRGTNFMTGEPFDITTRTDPQYVLQDNPTHGASAGFGIRFHAGYVQISPQIHYTRWNGQPFNEAGSQGFFAHSEQNQWDAMVAVTF
jgi:hypothetical protein